MLSMASILSICIHKRACGFSGHFEKPSNTLLLWQTMSPFPIIPSPKPRENVPTSLCAILGNKSNFYRKSEHGISRQRLSMMKVPVRVQYPHIRNPSGVERKMSATQVYKPGSSTQSVMMIIYGWDCALLQSPILVTRAASSCLLFFFWLAF